MYLYWVYHLYLMYLYWGYYFYCQWHVPLKEWMYYSVPQYVSFVSRLEWIWRWLQQSRVFLSLDCLWLNRRKQYQRFIVAEKPSLLEVDNFSIIDGLTTLLASFYVHYVGYTKSGPAAGLLLFLQEIILNKPAKHVRKPAHYSSLVNAMLLTVFHTTNTLNVYAKYCCKLFCKLCCTI